MAVAALGVAQLFAIAIKANLASKHQTTTAVLAVQKMEQLRGLTWGYVEGPNGVAGAAVTDLTTNLAVDPPDATGTGLRPSPAGTLDTNVAGFVDYLDALGTWVGTGASPPVKTVYIRRWSIEPMPSNPNDTLVLQVRVISARTEARKSTATVTAATRRLEDDTSLVSVKTRRAL
jgi:hypothetical protein